MRNRVAISLLSILAVLGYFAPASGQRVQIPATTQLQPNPTGTLVPSTGVTLGTPTFDPYAMPGVASTPPSLLGPPPTYAAPVAPAATAPFYGPSGNPFTQPPAVQPPLYSQPYTAPPYGAPYYPYQGPPVVPGGNWSGDLGRTNPYHPGEPLRLFQNIRIRHTWLSRMDKEEGLGINDSEVATTLNYPNFLGTTQPLYISPGFILHLWDGPVTPDLPPRAYTGYVDFDYVTNPQYRVGADLHVRTGVYSDFDAFNTDSFRVSGRGLGTFQMTPAVQLKAGVEYINRNDLKLLPAGGILWTPNPQVRFDIYFPKPKLAQYLTTIGNTEFWWYLAGEYGGGAWTIERLDGSDDRIDINDLRVMLGTEFMTGRTLKGFFEAGYVFEREVIYVNTPADSFDPPDTFMLRAGLAY